MKDEQSSLLRSKQAFIEALKEYGVVTHKDLENSENTLRSEIQASEKRLKRQMSKDKKEVITRIANVAVNSPTLEQFQELEQKVDRLGY